MKQPKRKRKSAVEPAPIAPVTQGDSPVESVRQINVDGSTELSYALASSCTMREAAALKAELLKLLSVAQPVLLDVGAVERIDTSALQLLCAFVRDRRARRLTTRWVGAQEAFTEAVEILGLGQALSYAPEARAA